MKGIYRTVIYATLGVFITILTVILFTSYNLPAQKRPINPIGQEEAWWLDKINYSRQIEAHDIERKVKVAVVDTGVNEEALPEGSVAEGFSFVGNSSDTRDENGHGTKCAYLIASPKLGINPHAVILPVKVRRAMSDDPKVVSEGIKWAADNGADIISLSLGKAPDRDNYHLGYSEGIEYALRKGVLVLAASGSSGDKVFYPGALEGVVCVGALGREYNYEFLFPAEDIDIFAVDIKDSISSSYPTAITAGAVSLVMSLDDVLSAQAALKIILDTADTIDIGGKEAKLINMDNAIRKVLEGE